MTGFGRATEKRGDHTIVVELRSLNSKHTDLRLRSNQQLREKEMELRRRVTDFAQRGKLEMTLDVRNAAGSDDVQLNVPLLNRLFTSIVDGADGRIGDESAAQLYAAFLRIPSVVRSSDAEIRPELWAGIQSVTEKCLTAFQAYRRQEGSVMADDLRGNATAIRDLLDQVAPHEPERIRVIRERMQKHLDEQIARHKVDENRFEQEVIYYLEKIDINEEQVRLRQNCDYFLEVLDNEQISKGRKLTFISQELGREINTLGAKAYSSDIQKLVVLMKEHLEQIKEQLANVV